MSEITLPKGWIRTQLGNAIDYGKCEKAEPASINDDAWVLELEDVEKDSSKVIQFFTFADRKSKSTKNKFKKGDVLYGKLRPYLNKVVMANNDGVCTTEIVPLNGGKLVNNKFIFYWLKTADFLTYVTAVGYGVNMPRLGTEDGKAAPFVLAPLAEQQQIGQKLDELLAQVDTLKARLAAIPKILKRFRQSVLAAAVSGRLTEEWREENCFPRYDSRAFSDKEKFKDELFARARDSLPDLPADWKIIPAAKIIDYITSGSRGWADYYSLEGALFLRMSNVRYNTTRLDLGDLQYVKLPISVEGKRSLVQIDDLLISITADVGRVGRIDRDLGEAYVNQHLALVRPIKNINSEYFASCIASFNVGVKQISELKRGATKAGLGLDDIRSLAIPLPSIEEQTEIVRRVEQLFTYADQIEQRVKDAQSRVNHLTQSILAKAFRGELTADWRAQNPGLISGENSAAAVLERIKAEREELKQLGKPKRTVVKKKTGSSMSKLIIKVVDALKKAGEPLSGQQLLTAAGYSNDSNTEELEKFFLDIRDALTIEKSIVKLERSEDGQDWFSLREAASDK